MCKICIVFVSQISLHFSFLVAYLIFLQSCSRTYVVSYKYLGVKNSINYKSRSFHEKLLSHRLFWRNIWLRKLLHKFSCFLQNVSYEHVTTWIYSVPCRCVLSCVSACMHIALSERYSSTPRNCWQITDLQGGVTFIWA